MKVGVECLWTIRERDRETGQIVTERQIKNVWTAFGLTALASAIGAAYTPPLYLVIESNYALLQLAYPSAGATTILTDIRIDGATDTQIVLSPGLATQEVVTFSGVTGTGPYTYTLSTPTVNAHSLSDPVCRQVYTGDDMTTVVNEIQYDSVNFAGLRAVSPGGYSGGIGNWTIQFYLTGTSALAYLMICGISDSNTIGAGNLHNHFILGYNHISATNDIEIDGSLTLSNI